CRGSYWCEPIVAWLERPREWSFQRVSPSRSLESAPRRRRCRGNQDKSNRESRSRNEHCLACEPSPPRYKPVARIIRSTLARPTFLCYEVYERQSHVDAGHGSQGSPTRHSVDLQNVPFSVGAGKEIDAGDDCPDCSRCADCQPFFNGVPCDILCS